MPADLPQERSTRPSKPRRVVQWAQERGEVGGVTRTVHLLTERLRAEGHEVTYVDTGSANRAVRGLRAVGGRHTRHIFHITRLWRAMVLAPVFALLPGRSALVLHSGSTARQVAEMSGAQRRLLAASLRAYDEIWGVNGEIVRAVPRSLADRVRVVTPYVDVTGEPPEDAESAENGAHEPHLMTVSTNANQSHYGIDLALEAMGLVRESWPDARLLVLAYGTDGPPMDALREELARVAWAELTWNLSPEEVRRRLSRSTVFLRPTSWEGDSVIVREALAAGARVVATDVSPRPAGVELAAASASELAEAVLRGGRPSDGAGLGSTSILDAARAFAGS